MAMANMNLIGVFVTKLWPVQALACGGGATKNIISPKFSNFGDIIKWQAHSPILLIFPITVLNLVNYLTSFLTCVTFSIYPYFDIFGIHT